MRNDVGAGAVAFAVFVVCAMLAAGMFVVGPGSAARDPEMPISPSSGFSDIQWTKFGAVLNPGGTNEGTHVQAPSVVRLPDGTYAMYYTASDYSTGWRIFSASSTDGLTWQKRGMALDLGGSYSTDSVLYPYVSLGSDGIYHMWYAGQAGGKQSIMHAISSDGVTFRYPGLVMTYGDTDGPSSVTTPCVLTEDGVYKMWYQGTSWSPTLHSWINFASKPVGDASWTKSGQVLGPGIAEDAKDTGMARVIATESGYEMFYTAIDASGAWRILHATSADGLAWAKDGVAIEPTLALEGTCVRWCSVIVENGIYRMWYSALSGNAMILYAEGTIPVVAHVDISADGVAASDAAPASGDSVTLTATIQGDASVMSESTVETPIFSDNFDDGCLDGWRLSHWNPVGMSQVTSARSHSAPYSWYAQSYSWENTGPWIGKVLGAEYQSIRAETHFQLPTKTQVYETTNILRMTSVVPGWVDTGGDVAADSNLLAVLHDDDYSLDVVEWLLTSEGTWCSTVHKWDVFTFEPNRWYLVSMTIDGFEYSVSVDGVTVTSGMRCDDRGIEWIMLGDTGGMGGGCGEAYWDDVGAWALSTTQTVEKFALNATCTVSFYLDLVAPENLIGLQAGVFVPADGTATASVEWLAVSGEHDIIAVATDVDPVDSDPSDNEVSAHVSVSEPSPAVLEISKVKLAGIDEGFTLTYYEWELQITVTNAGGSQATDVVVKDVLPAELKLLDLVASVGQTTVQSPDSPSTRSALPAPSISPLRSTHITWLVDTLLPGDSATLNMVICTRVNPGGNQEFTSSGTYSLNNGAWLTAVDSATGDDIAAGPTAPITVSISEPAAEPISGLPDISKPKPERNDATPMSWPAGFRKMLV
jgi:uncharacterized repeat protein (TIGR01451 family)